MKILYKFPSRSRPVKFFNTLDNIIEFAKHPDYLILCSLDLDDATMTTTEVKEKISSYGDKVKAVWGSSKTKIEAINADVWMVDDWDICIVMADDMVWHVEGFDLQIIELFNKHFPDTHGFLHLPDGKVNERLPTMCIIGKKLYDYFGWLYNPIYVSVACDNEQFDVVRLLGEYHYEPVDLFRHMHPIWGLAEMDDLYKRNEAPENYHKDVAIYRERKEKNFGL